MRRCYKDVSFWHPPSLHDNDVSEVVRAVCGDLVEDVQVTCRTHPCARHLACDSWARVRVRNWESDDMLINAL